MVTAISESILHAIGGTPIVRLRSVVEPGSADVLVKLEYYNPTGSYKDRMALAMIEGAEARGVLRPGMRVVEFTGGSTGSSLALSVR
jgi:cysteine synthase A